MKACSVCHRACDPNNAFLLVQRNRDGSFTKYFGCSTFCARTLGENLTGPMLAAPRVHLCQKCWIPIDIAVGNYVYQDKQHFHKQCPNLRPLEERDRRFYERRT